MACLMDIRRRILIAGVPDYLRLPFIYEKLPYITADGNQSLRTDYVPVIGDEFHLHFNGANGTIMSAGIGTYQLVLIGGFGRTGWYGRYFSSVTSNITPNYSVNAWYDLDIDQSGLIATNNQTFSATPQSELDGTAGKTLWICERRNLSQRYVGSIAEFWIKNNGKYKMYLVPCRRKSDQKVGMYDTISKTFFPSARSAFIAGT